jgi:formylmethanofuran dehydrogenase subunit C
MGWLHLALKQPPIAPLEAECISPTGFWGKSTDEITRLPLLHGRECVELGEFFDVQGSSPADGSQAERVVVEGDLSRVKYLGFAMDRGTLSIRGSAGMHLGERIAGGAIEVEGNADDWVGAQMSGGMIRVRGDAGNLVGATLPGEKQGASGGCILIHGDAGGEVGASMSGGLIAVAGDCGRFAGVGMSGGILAVCGNAGRRAGAGMTDGVLVCAGDLELLPTFAYSCDYRPIFLRLVWERLRRIGLEGWIQPRQVNGLYSRYLGDANDRGKGEILLCQTENNA